MRKWDALLASLPDTATTHIRPTPKAGAEDAASLPEATTQVHASMSCSVFRPPRWELRFSYVCPFIHQTGVTLSRAPCTCP